tara:strand:+ start:649 stop:1164 length:516 start_codon:yes stop_codon:yes gene_type:complete
MSEDKMLSLKEASILETFGTLDEERQKVLLQMLLDQSPLLNIRSTDHMSPDMEKLFDFCLKKWPLISRKFFSIVSERWSFITNNSLCPCKTRINNLYDYDFQILKEGQKCSKHSSAYFLYELYDFHWNSLYVSAKPDYEDEEIDDYLLSTVLSCPEDEYRKALEICGYPEP